MSVPLSPTNRLPRMNCSSTARTKAPDPAASVCLQRQRDRLPTPVVGINLMDETAAGPDDRVLIVGAPSAELLCEALRHGCRTALESTVPPKCPEPADVVVAPRVTTEEAASAVASCARRALAESRNGGRLALVLLGTGARAIARSITRQLRGYGFDRIRLRVQAEGNLLLVCHLQATTVTAGRAHR